LPTFTRVTYNQLTRYEGWQPLSDTLGDTLSNRQNTVQENPKRICIKKYNLHIILMNNPPEQLQPTARFSNRVSNYAKYRPSYPEAVIGFLQGAIGLQTEWTIADIGSGTGIFSELLLRSGHKVWGVEPNKEMREEAEKTLAGYKKFSSINGKAEQTFLTVNSIDLITVAQAFHWMDRAAAKEEFRRILKPKGFIVLLWNTRLTHTPFLKAFEDLKIKSGTDYKASRMVKEIDIVAFFHPKPLTQKDFYHAQILDYEALKGQLLSASYVPLEGEKHEQIILALEDIFNKYNENGFVKIEYETKVYVNT
jgi:ubiquinone/menaquinone biosynthesis C-methylase UbiE